MRSDAEDAKLAAQEEYQVAEQIDDIFADAEPSGEWLSYRRAVNSPQTNSLSHLGRG